MHKMFNQMQSFSKDINLGTSVPVDIRVEDDKVFLTADLPGVQKDDINLKADDKTVEISAESSTELKEENENTSEEKEVQKLQTTSGFMAYRD